MEVEDHRPRRDHGPKKPVLLRAFKPMGDCRSGSGTFTLRRRTAGNLTWQSTSTSARGPEPHRRLFGHGPGSRRGCHSPSRSAIGAASTVSDAGHWQSL
jgi:hypothetical protein